VVFSSKFLLKGGLSSCYGFCYSHKIKLSKAIQVDSHNFIYTYTMDQAPSAALSSPLSSQVDLSGCTAPPFQNGCLLRKTKVDREGSEHNSIYPRKLLGCTVTQTFQCTLWGTSLPHTVVPVPPIEEEVVSHMHNG